MSSCGCSVEWSQTWATVESGRGGEEARASNEEEDKEEDYEEEGQDKRGENEDEVKEEGEEEEGIRQEQWAVALTPPAQQPIYRSTFNQLSNQSSVICDATSTVGNSAKTGQSLYFRGGPTILRCLVRRRQPRYIMAGPHIGLRGTAPKLNTQVQW